MKKLIVILLTLTLVVASVIGLAACDNNTIIVYTEAGFAPFEYLEDGQIVGVDVDIMNLVGQKLGKKVKFENVGFDTIVDAVSKGKLCNVGAAGLSVTPEREEKVAFSKVYYTASLYVIYKKTNASIYESQTTDNVKGVYWDSLAGKTIAVQSGTTADLFLGDELAEGGILYGTGAVDMQCSTLAIAVNNVSSSGDADVFIIDELPAQVLVNADDTLACAPLYYKGDESAQDEAAVDQYAICVTKGQTQLLAAINEVLDELLANNGEGINKLVNKHLGLTVED